MTERVTWRQGNELSAGELHALLKLRVDVFVVEQDCAYAEVDGRDLLATTAHGFIADETSGAQDLSVLAAVRLLGDEQPARIGRVVTRSDARGRGLAAELVELAHRRAGVAGSFLDAQTYLVEWYGGLGWKVAGPEFVEDGIPHTPMRRDDR